MHAFSIAHILRLNAQVGHHSMFNAEGFDADETVGFVDGRSYGVSWLVF